ncbi:hypothetical protein MVEN_00384400 [Mycena venus]|uniref:ABM domain-containing protein n=1 Tax=Mycena venus TaxID=2733690 RepID=A0A8H6YUP2_9AGAR|nr:hypothetical protein MVEN_00384400 [Mycena venus]
MPAINIATFPVSDSFSNPDIFKGPMDLLKAAEGYKGAFYGLQIEDKKTGYFVSVWESYELREKMAKDPSYAGVIEQLKPAVAGPFTRDHINTTTDGLTALSAPVVEFVTATLKAGASAEKVSSLVEEFIKGLDGSAGSHAPAVWGQSVENKDKFLLIVGWDSLEAHQAVVKANAFSSTVSAIQELADISIGHSNVKKHE